MQQDGETITGVWHNNSQENTDDNSKTEYVEQENNGYLEQTDTHNFTNVNDYISIENESQEDSYISINDLNTVKKVREGTIAELIVNFDP